MHGLDRGAIMTVDESARLEVFEAFRESHGERIASALIQMLPPAGVPDLATKDDVALVRRDLAALEQRFEAFEHRIELRLAGSEDRVDVKIAGLDIRIAGLEAKLERELRAQGNRFIGWMFAGLATFGVASELAGRLI